MKKMVLTLAVSFFFTMTSVFAANPIGGMRDWVIVEKKPVSILEEFKRLPQTNVGHIKYRHNKKTYEISLVTADIRGNIVVFHYRGIDGGGDPLIPLYYFILEVRWSCDNKWCVWINKDLNTVSPPDPPLYEKPEFQPQAENAPF